MRNDRSKSMQLRTCQECGNHQWTSVPPEAGAISYWSWAGLKCTKCKSEGLDFGNTFGPGEEANYAKQ